MQCRYQDIYQTSKQFFYNRESVLDGEFDNFLPKYGSTVVERIKDIDMIIEAEINKDQDLECRMILPVEMSKSIVI